MLYPESTLSSTSVTSLSNAFSKPLCPLVILYNALTEAALKSLCFMYLILSRSSLEIIGLLILSFFACKGTMSKIL